MSSTDDYSGWQIVAMHKTKGAVSKQAKHVSAWIARNSGPLSVSNFAESLPSLLQPMAQISQSWMPSSRE